VLGDSHYGSEENLEEAALRGVEVVAPAMPPKGSQQGRPRDPLPGRPSPQVDERWQGSDPGVVRPDGLRRVPLDGLVPGLGGGPQGAAFPNTRETGSAIASVAWASGRRSFATDIAGGRGSRGRCRG
jgi:hypothetical protein